MPMPILDLANFSEQRLFAEIATGIPLIVQNAEHLDQAAERIGLVDENRASIVMQSLADEEAAKVLILLDVVRGPKNSALKARTLKNFNSHLAKRIYAMITSYPNIQSFKELSSFVHRERGAYYLDGPNDIDWILPNSIRNERERELYVDYVRDITERKGSYFWHEPINLGLSGNWHYRQSVTVRLCRALCDMGANSPDGLAEIAGIWRSFEPKSETCRSELYAIIRDMLSRLDRLGHAKADSETINLVLRYWTFPLWTFGPITLDEDISIEDLRTERDLTIQWIQKREAQREPPPEITCEKVEALHELYTTWRKDVEAEYARKHPSSAGLGGAPVFRSAEEIGEEFALPSYEHLENMFKKLGDSERLALLALAWFDRDRVADWPGAFKYAQERIATLDEDYQLGLASGWISGFRRWKQPPAKFRAGSIRRDR